jgi:hypothetical protein
VAAIASGYIAQSKFKRLRTRWVWKEHNVEIIYARSPHVHGTITATSMQISGSRTRTGESEVNNATYLNVGMSVKFSKYELNVGFGRNSEDRAGLHIINIQQ